jgi:hypothetical protein
MSVWVLNPVNYNRHCNCVCVCVCVGVGGVILCLRSPVMERAGVWCLQRGKITQNFCQFSEKLSPKTWQNWHNRNSNRAGEVKHITWNTYKLRESQGDVWEENGHWQEQDIKYSTLVTLTVDILRQAKFARWDHTNSSTSSSGDIGKPEINFVIRRYTSQQTRAFNPYLKSLAWNKLWWWPLGENKYKCQ